MGDAHGDPSAWADDDRALDRLEDVLHALAPDRAVPDLDEVLRRAEVDAGLLRRDDRACKLLREALLARPFGDLDEVARGRVEVELLTLEVEVVGERLTDRRATETERARACERLAGIRRRLDELRALL